MKNKNVLFLGQKPLGEACFNILVENQASNFQLKGVVSNNSLNNWWKSNNVYKFALKNKLPFISNSKRYDVNIQLLIKELKINTIISVQHPWIIPKSILMLVNGFAFNLHNAKLSEYRGYNSYSLAILDNKKKYTCTIHRMTQLVDVGNIIFEKTFNISKRETAKSLSIKAHKAALDIFKKFVFCLINDIDIKGKKIKNKGFFYSKHYLDKYRKITDIKNYKEVDVKARAFYFPPYEPAYFYIKKNKYYIYPS